jgi:phosphoribosylformimino-5-aminoimidazole carboxamide ribotide isomerase
MLIIPALYIHGGRLAAYQPADYENLQYVEGDPYEVISRIAEMDIPRIYLVDLDASVGGGSNNAGLIGSLANTCVPDIAVGGGLRDLDYLRSLQYAGVDEFVLGTVVFEDIHFLKQLKDSPGLQHARFSISLDLLDGQLTSRGWTHPEDKRVEDLIRECMGLGYHHFICTDMHPGKRESGPDLGLYQHLVSAFPEAQFTAAGQIHSLEHVAQLAALGVREAIIGDEAYLSETLLRSISDYNRGQGA